MDDPNTMPERMREIEIFGVPALYTNTPIDPEAIYPGMSLYELQGRDGKFLASVLTPVPIPVLADGPRDLKPGELVMDTEAGYYTPGLRRRGQRGTVWERKLTSSPCCRRSWRRTPRTIRTTCSWTLGS